jgi:hypothetical protein
MGANSPPTLQEALEGVIRNLDSHLFGYTPSELIVARSYFDSPAAQEMLIAAPQFAPASASAFPSKLARVAVTSGSMDGVRQAPSFALGQTVASFKIRFIKNQFMSYSTDVTLTAKLRGNVYYDTVPGSYMYPFDEAMVQFAKRELQIYQPLAPWRPITFVPTSSALAIAGDPTVRAFDVFKSKSPFDRYITIDPLWQPACTVFGAQTSLGQNGKHDVLATSQLDQLTCALNEFHRPGAAIPDRSFKTY